MRGFKNAAVHLVLIVCKHSLSTTLRKQCYPYVVILSLVSVLVNRKRPLETFVRSPGTGYVCKDLSTRPSASFSNALSPSQVDHPNRPVLPRHIPGTSTALNIN
jgi:hypothetical protein